MIQLSIYGSYFNYLSIIIARYIFGDGVCLFYKSRRTKRGLTEYAPDATAVAGIITQHA